MSEQNEHKDDMLDHDFDGIKELNNKAPAWLILIFYVTIGFSLLYLVHYFGYPDNGNDQASEYDSSVVRFEKEITLKKSSDSSSVALSSSQMADKGKVLYAEKGCVGCHGDLGQGASGPNLTDNFWLHGCSSEEVKTIITEGKPEKGMLSYKSMLSSDEISYVTEYILTSLVGSNPQNASAPKGQECK